MLLTFLKTATRHRDETITRPHDGQDMIIGRRDMTTGTTRRDTGTETVGATGTRDIARKTRRCSIGVHIVMSGIIRRRGQTTCLRGESMARHGASMALHGENTALQGGILARLERTMARLVRVMARPGAGKTIDPRGIVSLATTAEGVAPIDLTDLEEADSAEPSEDEIENEVYRPNDPVEQRPI
jgi:hypothetical protein